MVESTHGEEVQDGQDGNGDDGAPIHEGGDQGVSAPDRLPQEEEVAQKVPSVANFLIAALQSPHDGMEVYLANNIIGAAKHSKNHPAYLQWSVEDECITNVTGDPDRQDWFFLLRIPREVANELTEQKPKSLIIQP